MSALEQAPLPTTIGDERRTANRIRIANNIPVAIGRGNGVIVDLSLSGARVRHTVTALRGSNVRVSFLWHDERFAATAEVLASRVVALGSDARPTLYESRVRFRLVTDAAQQLLRHVLRYEF